MTAEGAAGLPGFSVDDVVAATGSWSAGSGPPIAWFTDPAGNVLSVLED